MVLVHVGIIVQKIPVLMEVFYVNALNLMDVQDPIYVILEVR